MNQPGISDALELLSQSTANRKLVYRTTECSAEVMVACGTIPGIFISSKACLVGSVFAVVSDEDVEKVRNPAMSRSVSFVHSE